MSARPKIPRETKRRVLIDSGHRCAVCGNGAGLEFAHIIPWHKSRDHSAENVICLCAGCHARADREKGKWGAEVLRRYKDKPWVARQFEKDGPAEGQTVKVTFTKVILTIESNSDDGENIDLADFLKTGLAGFASEQNDYDTETD